jgi:hypothetical protein
MTGTWNCPRCGQKLPLAEPSCRVCRITRENRGIVGRIEAPARAPKPPPEKVEIPFPFVIRDARFNLPVAGGSLWSSGCLVCLPEGIVLASSQDNLDPASLAARAPAVSGPVGPASIFLHRSQVARVVHHKMIGQFVEVRGAPKIPLRLETPGWKDLDVVCDALGIEHS